MWGMRCVSLIRVLSQRAGSQQRGWLESTDRSMAADNCYGRHASTAARSSHPAPTARPHHPRPDSHPAGRHALPLHSVGGTAPQPAFYPPSSSGGIMSQISSAGGRAQKLTSLKGMRQTEQSTVMPTRSIRSRTSSPTLSSSANSFRARTGSGWSELDSGGAGEKMNVPKLIGWG